ncbi:DNA cytosine methyltransferase [Parafilimonas sp.]|uniref:DNA cytosine methyltransferase n=1 Tax=Parafilimonas sp. TaxID=1969739 RepID=UPI0039E658AC
MPTAVSLFSGCGGSDFGLHQAGFEVLMANDKLGYASEVYKHNLPATDFKACDISTITSFPNSDILVGCYPCQGFSQGGVRDPNRKINYLYREFDRALRTIRPKAFIVENVSGMSRANFGHLLKNQITRFRMAGYKVKWDILNAAEYGVAQERKRIFIVGIRSNIQAEYFFPFPTHGPKSNQPYTTQMNVISDLPVWPEGEFCAQDFHWYYLSRNRRRNWNEPSKTIVSNMRHMPLHPNSPELKKIGNDAWAFISNEPARRLSYREAARLQGFDRHFTFPDTASLTMKYKVIGNAVPPPLFNAVASALPNIW